MLRRNPVNAYFLTVSVFVALSDAFWVVDNAGIGVEANPAFMKDFPGLALDIDSTTLQEVADYLETIGAERRVNSGAKRSKNSGQKKQEKGEWNEVGKRKCRVQG